MLILTSMMRLQIFSKAQSKSVCLELNLAIKLFVEQLFVNRIKHYDNWAIMAAVDANCWIDSLFRHRYLGYQSTGFER